MELNRYIDHTLLGQEAKEEEIRKICQEALEYRFKTVCVQPFWISLCKELLQGSEVGITTVVGFPLGANLKEVKAFEAANAIEDGADEIDMVLNIGALKSGREEDVINDIKAVREASQGKVLKVILETCLLEKEEIKRASLLSKEAGADFIKTSTGFSSGGAKVEDIELMRETVGPDLGIKASGGIRDQDKAMAMMKAGANRIGASKSIEIVKGRCL